MINGYNTTKIDVVHEGEDYFKIEVDGVESEVSKSTGQAIIRILDGLETLIANTSV